MHQCSVQGTTANVSVAGSDPISYEHNKMAVYRHDDTGLLHDVTRGTFVDGDSLTPIVGEMLAGSFYTAGHSMADTLRRHQANINKDIASGKISGPSKGIDVIAAPPVQEDVNLTEVMRAVNNQYKTVVNAWSILEQEAELQSKTSTTSQIPNHNTCSDSPSPVAFDASLSQLLHEGAGDTNLATATTVGQVNTRVRTASPNNLRGLDGVVDIEFVSPAAAGGGITRHGREAASADRNLVAPHNLGGHVGNPDLMSSNCPLRGQLTQDIVSALENHCPSSPVSSRQTGNAEEARQAFLANFPRGSVWDNFIQLTQAANFLGDMYGFTTKPSGMLLVCGCGKNHKQTKKETTFLLLDPGAEQVSQRRTDTLCQLNCEWVLRCRPQRKGKGETEAVPSPAR